MEAATALSHKYLQEFPQGHMTAKHMYQHPLVQGLKGYFITTQLA